MTVLEVIQKSAEFLAKKGVDSPRLQVELLLAEALSVPRLNLYLQFDRQLEPMHLDKVRQWVVRRGAREPLQHILGTTSFCGFPIRVTRDVLVPRPETELLAELAWKFLQSAPEAAPVAVDFGTGSGCIAIAIAKQSPSAKVHALDVAPAALAIARQNAADNAVADQIHFLQADSLGPLAGALRAWLVVSNPPYIPAGEIDGLMPEVRDHDPRQALDGGSDGLDFYRMLAEQAAAILEPGGKLMLELGDGQAGAVQSILEGCDWIVDPPLLDYSSIPRVMTARRGGAEGN